MTIVTLVIGLVVLIVGGDYLVKGASSIALRLHLTPLVVGLTIVAFGTSAPELLISVQSALKGSPDIATGNVIGSNICNLALVLGLSAVLRPVQVQQASISVDWPMAMGSAILLYLVMREGIIQVADGILFVIILVVYLAFIIRKSRSEHVPYHIRDNRADPPAPKKQLYKDIVFIVLGCSGLYFGSEWFVGSVRTLALEFGIEERVVGLTLVALGTSLPELVTAALASLKGQTDLALGNLMGSNIFNILSILGLTSIIMPIEVNPQLTEVDLVWLLSLTLLLLPLMLIKRNVDRLDGLILLVFYVVYIYFVLY
jgi:cation:H+ antiporter